MRLLAGLAISLCCAVGPASALTITSAKIQIELDHTTSVQLKGTLGDLIVQGTTLFKVTVDGIGFSVADGELASKGKKLRYANPTATRGFTEIVLDPSHGKFAAKLVGLPLGGVHSPFAVEVASDAGTGCALVPVVDPKAGKKPPKTPKPQKLKVVKLAKGRGNACGVGGPVFDPPQVLVGDPPAVHVSVALAATPTAASVKLYAADVAGLPTGDPLCTLADDGQAGDVAGDDGTFGCTLAIATAAPTVQKMVATADLGSVELRSRSSELRVVALPSDAEIDATAALQKLAEDTWAAKKTALGNSIAARFETVLFLQQQPGIRAVGLTSELGSISILYASGLLGVLDLETKRFPPASPLAAARSAGGGAAAPRALADPPPDDAEVVDSHKVLIWDPGYFDNEQTEVYDFYQLYSQSTCPKFTVDYRHGPDQTTIDSLSNLTTYGTVLIDTHGNYTDFKDGQAVHFNYFVTPQKNLFQIPFDTRRDAYLRHELVIYPDGVGIGPAYIRRLPGTATNAILLLGACFSGLDEGSTGEGSQPDFHEHFDPLAQAFNAKGFGAFWGFTRSVWGAYVVDISSKVFPDLITRHRTTTQAFDDFTPKIDEPGVQYSLLDPDPNTRPKDLLDARFKAAHFVMRPVHPKPIVYLKPTLTPKEPVLEPSGEVQLKVEIEGADDCSLFYRWRNTGNFGHLTGGDDDQTSASNTITYTAGAVAGTDTITLDIFDTGGTTAQGLFRMTRDVQVGCAVCATGTSGDDCPKVETCCENFTDDDGDGAVDCDDADCTGKDVCAGCGQGVPPNCPPGTFDPLTTCVRKSPLFDATLEPGTAGPNVVMKIRATATGLPFCKGFEITNDCIFATSIAAGGDEADPPGRPLQCAVGRTPGPVLTNNPEPTCDADILHTGCVRYDDTNPSYGPFWMAIPVQHLVNSSTKPADGTYVPGSLSGGGSNWQYTVVADALVHIAP